MTLTFPSNAWGHCLYWQKTDRAILKRFNALHLKVLASQNHLKHSLSGYWSRRINDEHRIVYKVTNDSLLIAQLRYHY